MRALITHDTVSIIPPSTAIPSRRTSRSCGLLWLLPLLLCGIGGRIEAHEEPTKTLQEKRVKEKERKRVKDLGIKSYTVWRTAPESNEPESVSQRWWTAEYDRQGRLIRFDLYLGEETPRETIHYAYDRRGNMILDRSEPMDGSPSEEARYSYDFRGRVKASENFAGDSILDSTFTYTRDPARGSIAFCKRLPDGTVDYVIDYVYEGLIDDGRLVKVVKSDRDGNVLLTVKNTYEGNQRRKKAVWEASGDLSHRFAYRYTPDGQLEEITRIDPAGIQLNRTRSQYDGQGNQITTDVFDRSDQVVEHNRFEYTYFK